MDAMVNERGGYRFLPAIDPYSSGVVAVDGYQIEHVTLQQPVPWEQGPRVIDDELRRRGRPRQALCNVQLRSPTPVSRPRYAKWSSPG